MSRSTPHLPFVALTLQPESDLPLYQQLYAELRAAILDGRLRRGTRLPATRTVAEQFGVSRNTVVSAFEQLTAEGYLESFVGDGSYVSRALPDDLLRARRNEVRLPAAPASKRRLSERGRMLANTPVSALRRNAPLRPFQPGIPAIDPFPFDVWTQITAKHWRKPDPALLVYGDPAGYRPLREAIAGYLNASRGVYCTADQVIVVHGSQQALDLTGRVLLDPGDPVWIENPAYRGAWAALGAAGARVVPVPLDAEGLDIQAAMQHEPQARLVYVSPSHQYPLGITMSLARRLALLEWATAHEAWILEDDYDSEYRYRSKPIAALQGLDRAGQVIYIGTFSKVLFPALRLGYLVVPRDLVEAFVTARALLDRHTPTLEQAVLAEFIEAGHFGKHIRRMRILYEERQQILVKAAAALLRGVLDVPPADAGMHLIGWLPEGVDDRAAAAAARTQGIDTAAVSDYALEPIGRGGLLLGYAAFDGQAIWQGTRQLAEALERHLVTVPKR